MLTAALSVAGCTTTSAHAAPTTTSTTAPTAYAPNSPGAVVQAQLEAYNAGELDAFMATFHPEAELFSIGNATPRAQGRDAVRAIYADLFARSPDLHSELMHRAILGNRVIDHERITGREGGEVLELIMVYEVEDGGIRRAWSIR